MVNVIISVLISNKISEIYVMLDFILDLYMYFLFKNLSIGVILDLDKVVIIVVIRFSSKMDFKLLSFFCF